MSQDHQSDRHKGILNEVSAYYSSKILEHGPTHQGVDWSSQASQEVRFKQLARLAESRQDATFIDVGCGYGAFLDYLHRERFTGAYTGVEISADMLAVAKARHPESMFSLGPGLQGQADYVVASGIFNVKLGRSVEEWTRYLLDTLGEFNSHASAGFGFNVLTKYSDKERMRSDLYYADPLFLFDYCKQNFAKDVCLLHDYGLYEFTILVRKLV
jgi:SAM-dependent methyltransferase